MTDRNAPQPSVSHALGWFNPRMKEVGKLGFIMNRVAGIGLTVYLFLHLAVLSTLARGPQAYNGFISLAHNPVFMFGEYLVVAAGLLHGLNGIRIAITSLSVGVPFQRQLFYALMSLAVTGCIYFAIRMFGGA